MKPVEDAHSGDEPVYRLLGMLCMVYGAFILLLMLIPNGVLGRLCFLFVGGVVGLTGVVLHAMAGKKRRQLVNQVVAPVDTTTAH